MPDFYLYAGEERKNKVASIDGQWDIILPTLAQVRGFPPGKLCDLVLEGKFAFRANGKNYSLRNEAGDWQNPVSILKAVDGREATLLQVFFGIQPVKAAES